MLPLFPVTPDVGGTMLVPGSHLDQVKLRMVKTWQRLLYPYQQRSFARKWGIDPTSTWRHSALGFKTGTLWSCWIFIRTVKSFPLYVYGNKRQVLHWAEPIRREDNLCWPITDQSRVMTTYIYTRRQKNDMILKWKPSPQPPISRPNLYQI